MVTATGSNGEPIVIEVLRHAHGVSNEELREPEYVFALGADEMRVRVPGPVALLKAKVANAADLDDQKGRQDETHVRILARLLPGYWQDSIAAALEGEIKERVVIERLESAFHVVRSKKGQTVLSRLKLSPREIFSGLEECELPKVRTFLEQRLAGCSWFQDYLILT